MKQIFLLCFLCFSLFSNAQKNTFYELEINFNIRKCGDPLAFKVTKSFVFIATNTSVFIYNKKGKMIKKLKIPVIREALISSFDVVENNRQVIISIISGENHICFDSDSNILFKTKTSGLLHKLDTFANSYILYQKYDKEKGVVKNLINMVSSNTIKDLDIDLDFATLNFEIINNCITFNIQNGSFYNIDVSNPKIAYTYLSDLDKGEFGSTQLLGKNNDYYLFLCQDDNGTEYILSYDMKLIFNKKRLLKKNEFTTGILHDQEFLTLHPSGIMFSYSSNTVFQMLIKDNSVIISELHE